MGFGHRVYKNYDPRAGVLKESADEVLEDLGQSDNPLLDIARELEKIALNDDYFVQRKLFPNVDFYSGIILEAMGIPTRDVHRDLRAGADRGLDRAVERDDRGPGAEDRPPAPALHRPRAARFRADERAAVGLRRPSSWR